MCISAKEDWSTDGISLCSNHSDTHLPDLAEVHEIFEVVFMDVTGYVNLCSDMTKSLFYRVGVRADFILHEIFSQDDILQNNTWCLVHWIDFTRIKNLVLKSNKN